MAKNGKEVAAQPERPWLAHYPAGTSWEIDTKAYANVLELLEEAFQKYAGCPAQENLGYEMSYAELERQSRQLAAFFQARGLRPGDTLAIQMPNVLQYAVTLFAGIRAGLRLVNINPLYTPAEMRRPLLDSRAKAIVILANFAHKLESVLPETEVELVLVTEIADAIPGLRRLLINFVVKYLKKMVPRYRLPASISWRAAIASGAHSRYERPQVPSDQTLFLQYTGGTTGVPKAADLTHANIVANVLQCKAAFTTLRPGVEVMLAALPFYHIFGLTVNAIFMMHLGAKLVLITNPRDIPAFIKILSKSRYTMFTGLNTLFNALMQHPDFTKIDFSHSKLNVGGGMAMQQAVAQRWLELTGKPILEGYGLSETSPVLCCNVPSQNVPGSIGQPFPATEIAILDPEGQRVPLGERGEICARGPQVMRGYFERPDETARVFTADGWFRTGDIGTMDERGYVRIVDRLKDMILVSGFNVYPNEVEEVLITHPGVRECAVIGIPDPQSTERVKACVVRKDSSVTEEELIEHCRKSLTGYKVPKVVQFYEELPKSNVGKIIRRELR
ncbi:MAG TPA: AMP-binding protein [Polyangiaceae bacterium]|jgi:long-chain acyl-CoA synthetase|nr:AMP-binding protein [Polyangiaceae bacterium]